jgi:hypothetical protein
MDVSQRPICDYYSDSVRMSISKVNRAAVNTAGDAVVVVVSSAVISECYTIHPIETPISVAL